MKKIKIQIDKSDPPDVLRWETYLNYGQYYLTESDFRQPWYKRLWKFIWRKIRREYGT